MNTLYMGTLQSVPSHKKPKKLHAQVATPLNIKGLPNLRDRFVQYGIRMSFWGSGTLKIVIYVENYPQKRCFRLADYHPSGGGGVLISGHNIYTYYICTYRG